MGFWKCRCNAPHTEDEDKCKQCKQNRDNGEEVSSLDLMRFVGSEINRAESPLVTFQEAIDGEFVSTTEAEAMKSLSKLSSAISEELGQVVDQVNNTAILPENITNVKHLDDIAKLRHYGFEGPDEDLCTSLHEYGLVWRRTGISHVLFIYPKPEMTHSVVAPERPTRYCRCTLSDMEFDSDFDWIDDEEWERIIPGGQTFDEWRETKPLEQRIYDIFQYYGPLEVFGNTYWEGFLIEDPDDPKYLKYLRAEVYVELLPMHERRSKVGRTEALLNQIRRRVLERMRSTGIADPEDVSMPEIVYRTETVKVNITLQPEAIDDRWPDLYARKQKAIIAEDVAHEVDMAMKELGVGHVTGVKPDLEYQQQMESLEE